MRRISSIIAAIALSTLTALGGITRGPGDVASINAWHSAAVDGDVYIMDPGTWSWAHSPNRVAITKNVTLFGSGQDQTFIEDDGDDSDSVSNILSLGGSGSWRISNFTIKDDSGPTHSGANWQIRIESGSGFSIDNITFQKKTNGGGSSRRPFYIAGPSSGVIWGCTFNQERQVCYARNRVVSSTDWGDNGWNNPPDIGGQNQIVWEDNTHGRAATFDGDGGSWMTVRKSVMHNAYVGYHGTESSSRYRGGRWYEVYHNTATWDTDVSTSQFVDLRSGSAIIFGNTIDNNTSGNPSRIVKFNAYRMAFPFKPWGIADGVVPFDYLDTSDDGTGFDNSGSAGDGIFHQGTIATRDSQFTFTASGSPGWSDNMWSGYTLRLVGPSGTMAAGSSGHTVTVDNQTWTADQWDGYLLHNVTDGKVNVVASHDTPTASLGTINTGFPPVDQDGWRDTSADPGDQFAIYHAGQISSNTSDTITLVSGFDGSWDRLQAGITFEIRSLLGVLDGNGMGDATSDFPETGTTVDVRNTGQAVGGRPIYVFDNTTDTSGIVSNTAGRSVRSDLHYFLENASFNGTSGVGVGVKADISPGGAHETASTVGVGYWVTDEADWDSTSPGTDGQFYQWDGAAWVLYYTPLDYPHPIRATLAALPGAEASYNGRIRLDNTKRPIKADGTGRPYIFSN